MRCHSPRPPRSPRPADEEDRQAALDACEVLGSADEEVFDSLVRLAAHICRTERAAITLIDRDRAWIKARVGLTLSQLSRDASFAAYAILDPDHTLVVSDVFQDHRFAHPPEAVALLGARFYAGVPLSVGDGHAVGVLDVFDHRPRHLAKSQMEALRTLAVQTQSQLELRYRAQELPRLREELVILQQRLAGAEL